MAFPDVTTSIDDFNRADALDVATGGGSTIWDTTLPAYGGSAFPLTVSGNVATGGAGGNDSLLLGTFTDFTIACDIPAAPTGYVAIFFRVANETNGATWTAYWLIIDNTGLWKFRKRVGGTASDLTSASGVTLASGDKIGLKASGSALTAYRYTGGAWNQTPVLSTTDTALTSGRVSFELGDSTVRIDNVIGGALAGGGTAPSNTVAPAVTPTSATVGDTLSTDNGTWTGTPTITYTYQWQRDGTNISGATSASYATSAPDQAHAIRCVVTASNGAGSASANSNAVTPGAPTGPPANTGAPAVTGQAVSGQTLSCSTGTWTNLPTGYAYQWQRDTVNIAGQTSATYLLADADVPRSIRCVVTASNAQGSAAANSNAVVPTAPPTAATFRLNIGGAWQEILVGGGDGITCDNYIVGSTDDQAAIAAAVADVVAQGVADGSYYGEIRVPAGDHVLTGSTTLGGATKGNAKIPLPILDPTVGQKFTLVFRGVADAAPFLHWHQTVPQRNGSVLRTADTAPAPDGTWGNPSIIGGPTGNATAGDAFSNMRVIFDGVLIGAPANPGWIGIDGRYLAQMDTPNLGVLAQGTPGQVSGPTNSNGVAVYFPKPDNNDSCNVGVLAVEGWYYGVAFADHLVAQRLGLIYCNTALFVNDQDGGSVHGSAIQYATVEACATILEATTGASTQYPLDAYINAEVITGTAFKDTLSGLRGDIRYTLIDNSGADASVTGCGGIRLVNVFRKPGAITAPTYTAGSPASIHANAAVTLGTGVTNVSVDGQSLGVGAGATVIVPANKQIVPTGAGSWKWTVL